MWLDGLEPLKVSQQPATFGGHKDCGSGDIMILVCYMILQDIFLVTEGQDSTCSRLNLPEGTRHILLISSVFAWDNNKWNILKVFVSSSKNTHEKQKERK